MHRVLSFPSALQSQAGAVPLLGPGFPLISAEPKRERRGGWQSGALPALPPPNTGLNLYRLSTCQVPSFWFSPRKSELWLNASRPFLKLLRTESKWYKAWSKYLSKCFNLTWGSLRKQQKHTTCVSAHNHCWCHLPLLSAKLSSIMFSEMCLRFSSKPQLMAWALSLG